MGNDCELIPTVKMEVDIPYRAHFVVSFHRSISLQSYRGLKSQVIENFGEKFAFSKRPLTGTFSKFCSERIHRDTDPRLMCKFL